VAVTRNYAFGSKVTPKMLEAAQHVINNLLEFADNGNLQECNLLLAELYATIPRKMGKVMDYLAHDMSQLRVILAHEQELLDTLAASISTVEVVGDVTSYPFILADASDDDYRRVKNTLNCTPAHLVKVTRNNEPELKDSRLLWHGSREQNWYHILTEGLRIRPATAVLSGSAFGYGIYFADMYQKSLNYCNGGKYIALVEVELGNMLHLSWGNTDTYRLDWEKLRRKGNYDSVMGDASMGSLRHNEYIVYRPEQQRIKYLMEVI